jgi:hypothetical protein
VAEAEGEWSEDEEQPAQPDILDAWRAKYPGVYDKYPDDVLAKAIQDKWPGVYDNKLAKYLPAPDSAGSLPPSAPGVMPSSRDRVNTALSTAATWVKAPWDVANKTAEIATDMVGQLGGRAIRAGEGAVENALPSGPKEVFHSLTHADIPGFVDELSGGRIGKNPIGAAGLGLLDTVQGLTSPEGLATIGALMGAPEGIMPIVSGYFAKQMASGAWDKWPAMKQAAQQGDWATFARAAASAGTEGLMALMAFRHALASTIGWAPEKGTAEPFDLKKETAKIQKNFDQKTDLVAQMTQTDPAKVQGPSAKGGLSRFEPTMPEREQMRRLSEANGGVIDSDQVPASIQKKIQQLQWLQGGKGGWNDPDTIDRTMKYFFDQGVTKDQLASIIGRGIANELSPDEQKIFDFALDKVAPQQQRGVTAAAFQRYLTENSFATRVVTPRERVMALGRENLKPLDPSDLPDISESGKSRIGAVGVNGEPVDRLNPPDENLQTTLAAHLRTIFGNDPQQIAQGLAGFYGVKEPVQLAFDEEAEDTPSTVQNADGSWTVTLPPDATPYEVAHEIAMHAAGWDDEGFPHDNNKIAARVISDLETAGQTRFYDNRLPRWGTPAAEGTVAPGGDAPTWTLGFGDGETKAEIPYLRHIYDPHGVLHPMNLVRDYPLGRTVSNLVMMAPDVMTARGAIGKWLRDQGFDGYVWSKDGDWHVSATPTGDKFLEGGAHMAPGGLPLDGAPDGMRIYKNLSTLDRLKQVAANLTPDIVKEVEESLKGKSLSSWIAQKIAPMSMVPDKYKFAAYEGLSSGRKMLFDFLRQADLAQRSRFFDGRADNDNVAFIKGLQLGQFRKGEYNAEFVGAEDEELREHADHIQNWEDKFYDAVNAVVKKAGIERLVPFLEDHLTNIWKESDGMDKVRAQQAAANRSLMQTPAEGAADFLKRRVNETLEDGINAGLTPVTTNPYVIQQLRGMQMARFMSAIDMMRNWRETGGVRLVPDVNEADFQKTHPDWKLMQDSDSNRYFPTREGPFSAGHYWMEPNVARIFQNYTSHNMLGDIYAGRLMGAAKNGLTALELGFSPFHGSVVTLEHFASAIGRAARSINTQGSSGLQEMKKGLTDYWKALDPNTSIVDMVNSLTEDEQAKVVRSGLGSNLLPGVVPRTATFETVKAALNSSKPLLATARALPAVSEFLTRYLFSEFIPKLKLMGFQRELSTSMLENAEGLADGKIDPESLLQTARRRMEDRFGQMNWDNLFWDKTMSGVMKLALRSTTWKLGSMRAVGGAVQAFGKRSPLIDTLRRAPDAMSKALIPEMDDPIQTAQAIAGDKAPDPNFLNTRIGADVGWLLGTLTVNGIAASLYQMVMTGKSPGQTDAGTHDPELALQDLTSPRMGGKDAWGHDARANMPSYVREMRSAGMAVKDAFGGQFGKAGSYLEHSTSALFGRLMESFQNKDYYGKQIYDRNDTLTQNVCSFLAHIVPPPIVWQSMSQPGTTPLAAAGAWGGFTRASSRYQMSDFETWLSDEAAHRYAGLPGKEPSQEPATPPKPKTMADRIAKVDNFRLVMYGWDKMTPEEQAKYAPLVWKKANQPYFTNNLRRSSQGQDNGGRWAAFLTKRDQMEAQIRAARATLSGGAGGTQ